MEDSNGGSKSIGKRASLSVPCDLASMGLINSPAQSPGISPREGGDGSTGQTSKGVRSGGLPDVKSATSLAGHAHPERNITRVADWVAPHPQTLLAEQEGYRVLPGDVANKRPVEKGVLQTLTRRVPILGWLPKYDIEACLFNDFIGGVTLALICLVQTLAHAAIATTDVIQGPYCAFMPPLVYAVLGTSKHASISSGAIVSIIIADQLAPFHDIQERTELASLLALVSGAMLVLMGMCRAAFAVRFLSQSLISGFVTGGAILIMQGQLKNLLGLMRMGDVRGFIPVCVAMWEDLHETNMTGTVLGVLMIVGLQKMVHLKKFAAARLKGPKPHPFWLKPAKMMSEMKEIVMVVIGLSFSFATAGDGETVLPFVGPVAPLPIVGNIPAGLPPFKAPWSLPAAQKLLAEGGPRLHSFFMGGALIALTSFLSTYASAKKQAINHNYRLDGVQETFALGVAGISGSFFGSFTPSGSLSRTSLSAEVGVKTQMNGIMMTLVSSVGLLYLTPVLKFLPKATLAAIILKSAWALLDFATFRKLWKQRRSFREGGQRRDLIIWCIAFSITVCSGALFGIGSAVVVALALIVYDAATPQVTTLGCVQSVGNLWRNVEVWPEAKTIPGILVVEFRGPLCFASAECFQDELEGKIQAYSEDSDDQVKVVVLHFGSVHDLDTTAVNMLRDVLTQWRKQDVACVVAEAKSRVRLVLERELGARSTDKAQAQPLLDQPAFLISVDDAVDFALRRLGGSPRKRAPWRSRKSGRWSQRRPAEV